MPPLLGVAGTITLGLSDLKTDLHSPALAFPSVAGKVWAPTVLGLARTGIGLFRNAFNLAQAGISYILKVLGR